MSTVREARAGDLAAIVEIERAAFGLPWGGATVAAELQRPIAVVEVLEHAGRICGYSCTWYLDVDAEAHLLRIAVGPKAQGRGCGRRLLQAVLARAERREGCRVLLEVASKNAAARALYATTGFVEIARRRNYYGAPVDDAIVMERRAEFGARE